MGESKRVQYETLRGQLDTERSSFTPYWRDLADFVLPRRIRLNPTEANKGDRRNQKIIDSTATLSARTLRSGMMSGITSPARPWFRLTTPDPGLAEFGPTKQWLQVVTDRMTTVFGKSNLYNVLPIIYGDIGVFATGAMGVEEDFDSVIRCYPFPIGSYKIANNDRLKVDVFTRDFRMTVRQLVQRFGKKKTNGDVDWSNFSSHVKNLWDLKNLETWIDVCHVIVPNTDYDPDKIHAKYKRYASCYYERGSSVSGSDNYMNNEPEKYLRESGYDLFPILCPRWEVTGEDVYGTDCPAMTSLGDIKALQLMQRRKAEAIEKMVRPPMIAPTSLKGHKLSILPGDISFSDDREGMKGFRSAHEVNLKITDLMGDIQDHQGRIRRGFFEDLFLMIAESDRRQITAREIDERKEEKLLALGPVLEQLNQDLLDPLIDLTFDIMNRQGLIPAPPDELKGLPLRVEYMSIMAQAQKLIGVSGTERFSNWLTQLLPVFPDSADKVSVDRMIEIYGDQTAQAPGVVRDQEETQQIRQQKQQVAAAQHQAEMAQAATESAKNLSQTDTGGDNALTQLMQASRAGQIAPTQ